MALKISGVLMIVPASVRAICAMAQTTAPPLVTRVSPESVRDSTAVSTESDVRELHATDVEDLYFILAPPGVLGFNCDGVVILSLVIMCDGSAECANGEDETTELCASESLNAPIKQSSYLETHVTHENKTSQA